jgi:hypothetical protein
MTEPKVEHGRVALVLIKGQIHLISRVVAFFKKIRFTYWYEKRHDVKVGLE